MAKIYLSPSNQNDNAYAVGNTNEMIQCNRIAEYAKSALERNGFSVKKAPQGQSMTASVSESNSWNADMHIPIHTNAFNGTLTGGTLVMIYSSASENLKAASALLNSVAPITPGKDYAIQVRTNLYELSATKAVAVYLEVEFHDTAQGAAWIINNVKKVGEAIAKGVCDYYNVAYKGESPVTDTLYRVRKSWKDEKSQIGAFSVLENAKSMANNNFGYYVFDEKGEIVYAKKQELKNAPLYVSSTEKAKTKDISGTYYLWSSEVINNRVKITNSVKNIGVNGQVTGWTDKKYTG